MSGKPLIFVVVDTPAEWFGLSCQEKAVLVSLVSHLNSKRNGTEVWPSLDRLARLAGLGERTVRRAMRQLEQLGIIKTRTDTGRSNVYSIHVEVIHRLAYPGQSGRGSDTDPGHSDRGTPARVAGPPGQSGRLTTKEQPTGTAERVSSFGCSGNPKVIDGPHQRKLAVHGLVASAVKPVSKHDQEQPTIEKPGIAVR